MTPCMTPPSPQGKTRRLIAVSCGIQVGPTVQRSHPFSRGSCATQPRRAHLPRLALHPRVQQRERIPPPSPDGQPMYSTPVLWSLCLACVYWGRDETCSLSNHPELQECKVDQAKTRIAEAKTQFFPEGRAPPALAEPPGFWDPFWTNIPIWSEGPCAHPRAVTLLLFRATPKLRTRSRRCKVLQGRNGSRPNKQDYYTYFEIPAEK